MKKQIIYKVTSVLLLSLPLVTLAVAGSLPTGLTGPTAASVKDIVDAVFKIFGVLAGAIAMVFVALGLFKFATSGGDPRALDEAKTSLIWGAVGIAIAVLLGNIANILTFFNITWAT